MSRTLRRLAIALLTSLALATLPGCGSDDEPSGNPTPSESPSTGSNDSPTPSPSESAGASPTRRPAGKVVEVDLTAGAEPRKVKVNAGKPFTLRIVTDEAGELHVHSTPERYVEFGPGTTRKKLTIEQPGVVDVEDHATDELVVQLEVR